MKYILLLCIVPYIHANFADQLLAIHADAVKTCRKIECAYLNDRLKESDPQAYSANLVTWNLEGHEDTEKTKREFEELDNMSMDMLRNLAMGNGNGVAYTFKRCIDIDVAENGREQSIRYQHHPKFWECNEDGVFITQRGIAAWKVQAVEDYGCHCFFDERALQTYGAPVDWVDEHCHLLNEGYRCAKEQTENETGEECNPWDEDYDIEISDVLWSQDPDHYGMACVACKTKYATLCQQRACVIETHFLLNLYFSNNDDLNEEYMASNPDWDRSTGCVVTTPPPPPTPTPSKPPTPSKRKMCCGVYPLVKKSRYYGDREDNACCGFAVYNINSYQCCGEEGNNQVKPIGEDCPPVVPEFPDEDHE